MYNYLKNSLKTVAGSNSDTLRTFISYFLLNTVETFMNESVGSDSYSNWKVAI